MQKFNLDKTSAMYSFEWYHLRCKKTQKKLLTWLKMEWLFIAGLAFYFYNFATSLFKFWYHLKDASTDETHENLRFQFF